MRVLIDSSIWIDYFNSGANSAALDQLIDNNSIATNELILTELLPFMQFRKQFELAKTMNSIHMFKLHIDWIQIRDFQLKCLENGVNGVGIPDLIIAQNARQNGGLIFSMDKHFKLMKDLLNFRLFEG